MIYEEIQLIENIDFQNYLNIGLKYGFIMSIGVGLFGLGLYLAFKLFNEI
ncbi:MAG: hypothetical protein RBR71_13865 [Gudongella sp.]|nr:hypothetical protein [Gudongella sp.]